MCGGYDFCVVICGSLGHDLYGIPQHLNDVSLKEIFVRNIQANIILYTRNKLQIYGVVIGFDNRIFDVSDRNKFA
jgi:hypothetical protein